MNPIFPFSPGANQLAHHGATARSRMIVMSPAGLIVVLMGAMVLPLQ